MFQNFAYVSKLTKNNSPHVFEIALETILINHLIIYMKKFLNSDWLRAVQFFRNTVPKSKIHCKK